MDYPPTAEIDATANLSISIEKIAHTSTWTFNNTAVDRFHRKIAFRSKRAFDALTATGVVRSPAAPIIETIFATGFLCVYEHAKNIYCCFFFSAGILLILLFVLPLSLSLSAPVSLCRRRRRRRLAVRPIIVAEHVTVLFCTLLTNRSVVRR